MWIEELNNSDADSQSRAAYHLFVEDPNSVRTDARASGSLERLIDKSEPLPAAVLLASFAPTARTTGLLLKLKKESGDLPAKLHPWSHPVRLLWAIDLALSRLGDSDARSALLESIDKATLDERLLLLDAIEAVDDPTLLRQLGKYLSDSTEISRGVPSGAAPKRRLQDHAVDKLIARLHLPVTFAADPSRRYTGAEIEETRKLLRSSIPS